MLFLLNALLVVVTVLSLRRGAMVTVWTAPTGLLPYLTMMGPMALALMLTLVRWLSVRCMSVLQ